MAAAPDLTATPGALAGGAGHGGGVVAGMGGGVTLLTTPTPPADALHHFDPAAHTFHHMWG